MYISIIRQHNLYGVRKRRSVPFDHVFSVFGFLRKSALTVSSQFECVSQYTNNKRGILHYIFRVIFSFICVFLREVLRMSHQCDCFLRQKYK